MSSLRFFVHPIEPPARDTETANLFPQESPAGRYSMGSLFCGMSDQIYAPSMYVLLHTSNGLSSVHCISLLTVSCPHLQLHPTPQLSLGTDCRGHSRPKSKSSFRTLHRGFFASHGPECARSIYIRKYGTSTALVCHCLERPQSDQGSACSHNPNPHTSQGLQMQNH